MNDGVNVWAILAALSAVLAVVGAGMVGYLRLFMGKALAEQTGDIKEWINAQFVAKEINDLKLAQLQEKVDEMSVWKATRVAEITLEKNRIEDMVSSFLEKRGK